MLPRDPAPGEISSLLEQWSAGDAEALNRLLELLYRELRRLAHAYMRRERPGNTLQTTAVVNELYLRLAAQRRPNSRTRAQFFGISAQLMRRILVDHARSKRYAKRGGAATRVPLEETVLLSPQNGVDVLALDQAIQRLAQVDARKARVVELRYFGGMTIEEIEGALGVSSVTVLRDWSFARAWLRRELTK
jgi:RNA polymerase sigma-70 factor, ECF subfamily